MGRYEKFCLEVVLCCSLMLVTGCASSDSLTSGAIFPITLRHSPKILVISVGKNPVQRRIWEDAFSAELSTHQSRQLLRIDCSRTHCRHQSGCSDRAVKQLRPESWSTVGFLRKRQQSTCKDIRQESRTCALIVTMTVCDVLSRYRACRIR